MIEVINLNKSFSGKIVLEKLNCSFQSGQFNAIIGPSGVGKTSLLRILMGLDKDYTGSIKGLEGRTISPVFQENRLLPNYSIYDNINLVMDRDLDPEKLDLYLKRLNLRLDSSELVGNLSGGMARRVAILRALLKEADLYIFDEAFKDMDPKNHRLVLELIKEELKGKTLIFTSHNQLDLEVLEPNLIELK